MRTYPDKFDFKTNKKKSKESLKSPKSKIKTELSLFRFLGLAFVGSSLWYGGVNLKNTNGKTITEKAKTALKNLIPNTANGTFNFALTGSNLLIIMLMLHYKRERANRKPLNEILYTNQTGKQSVSKEVFDKLVFKNVSTNKKNTTNYSALDRKTLEEKTKILNFSYLTPEEQQTLLQKIIDICDESPALAKLFRMEIFPTTIVKTKNKSDTLCFYGTSNKGFVIGYTDDNIFNIDLFMHEYAHAMQDNKGFYTSFKNTGPIEYISQIFMEAQAYAYDIICLPHSTNSMMRDYFYLQTVREIKKKAYNNEIKLPSSHLTDDEKKRYIWGITQEQTIGKIMELFLSLPCDVEKRIAKNQLTPYFDEKTKNYALKCIHSFHLGYETDRAFRAMKNYPNTTQQLLTAYSNMMGYNIELSDPQNAAEEFRKMRRTQHAKITAQKTLTLINTNTPKER